MLNPMLVGMQKSDLNITSVFSEDQISSTRHRPEQCFVGAMNHIFWSLRAQAKLLW